MFSRSNCLIFQSLKLQQINCCKTLKRQKNKYAAGVEDMYKSDGDADAMVNVESRYIHKSEVERFMVDCMVKMGTEEPRAKMLAANLSEADYRGHFSHGLSRLAVYIQDIEAGFNAPNNDPKILKEGPATAWVDAQNGLGVVCGTFCMELAMRKAKEVGIGWVAAKGSNHFGICQWYTNMATKKGLVGISSTNTSPVVTPTRGGKAVYGTNPICIAAPAKDGDSFILDMATSAVALGKIEIQMRKKEPLPSKFWALGTDGKPTTDPHEAFYNGSGLMPLGGDEMNSGYKGYGIALLVELLTSLMSGATYAHNVRSWTSFDKKADLGQCFAAIDPDVFAPDLQERLQDLMDYLRTMDPVDPDKPVLVPGDPERNSIRTVELDQKGAIFYTPNHITTYAELAKKLGVNPMKPFPVI